jgi:hypothetical protein
MPDSRRQFMKRSSIGVLSIVSTSGVVGARGNSGPEAQVALRGTPQNPVSTKDILKRKKGVVRASGREDRMFAVVPKSENQTVLAYNFFLDEEGTPREQYLTTRTSIGIQSVGGTEIDVQSRHERADRWLTDPPSAGQSGKDTVNTASVSTNADENWSDWIGRDNFYTEHEVAPFGVIIANYKLKSDPDSDLYGLETGVELESGKNRERNANDDDYNDRWQNKEGLIVQNWNQNGDSDLKDRFPRGNESNEHNETSVSLDAGGDASGPSAGVSVSKTYSQPESEVLDKSSKIDDITRYNLKNAPNSDSAQWTCYYNPSSLATVSFDSCGPPTWWETVVDIDFTATWGDTNFFGQWVPRTETETISHGLATMC